MKKLDTLVEDIYKLFDPKTHHEPTQEDLDAFASTVTTQIRSRMAEITEPPRLRFSNLGKPCTRELWYSINKPSLGEPMHPTAYIKFLFGAIIESLVLLLAKTAGHTVQNEQESFEIEGIRGSSDATIDGVLVDVKSASSYSYHKFNEGLTKDADAFGYLTQLGLYNFAAGRSNNPAAFIAFDKTLGKLCVDTHNDINSADYVALVKSRKALVSSPVMPPRYFSDEPEGASGNRKLGVNCSYCAFKKSCWPGLQAYMYSKGPMYLTHVAKEPKVDKLW